MVAMATAVMFSILTSVSNDVSEKVKIGWDSYYSYLKKESAIVSVIFFN